MDLCGAERERACDWPCGARKRPFRGHALAPEGQKRPPQGHARASGASIHEPVSIFVSFQKICSLYGGALSVSCYKSTQMSWHVRVSATGRRRESTDVRGPAGEALSYLSHTQHSGRCGCMWRPHLPPLGEDSYIPTMRGFTHVWDGFVIYIHTHTISLPGSWGCPIICASTAGESAPVEAGAISIRSYIPIHKTPKQGRMEELE